MEPHYHFGLYWRSNLSRPAGQVKDAGSLPVFLGLTGSRCDRQVSDLGCAARQLTRAPLPLPWDEVQRVRLLVPQEHIPAAGQPKPQPHSCFKHRCWQPAKGKRCWFTCKALCVGGNGRGRKSRYALFIRRSKAGVRRRLKRHLSHREQSTHGKVAVGLTQPIYLEIIPLPSWYLSISPQHAKCLDSFTVPSLFCPPCCRPLPPPPNRGRQITGLKKRTPA